MSKTFYEYVIVSKIIDKSIPAKLKEIFSDIQKGQTISTGSIFDENRQYLLNTYNENQTNCKRVLSIAMKIAYDQADYTLAYLPSNQDVATDESYGFVYGLGGILVHVLFFDLSLEQTDTFITSLVSQRNNSTSTIIDDKRIFLSNWITGQTMSEVVVYDPQLHLSTHVSYYYHDLDTLEQLALSMGFE